MLERFHAVVSSRGSAGRILRPAVRLAVAAALALLLVAGAAAAVPRNLHGKIVEVDLGADTFTVEDAVHGRVRLLVDEKTVIVLDGDEQATIDDLFEGDVLLSAELRELNSGGLLVLKASVTSPPGALDEDEDGDPTPAPAPPAPPPKPPGTAR